MTIDLHFCGWALDAGEARVPAFVGARQHVRGVEPLSFSLVAAPEGSAATFADDDGFTPDVAGTFVLRAARKSGEARQLAVVAFDADAIDFLTLWHARHGGFQGLTPLSEREVLDKLRNMLRHEPAWEPDGSRQSFTTGTANAPHLASYGI